jgi:periplasmic protein TonB
MMERNIHENSSQKLALATAICLHLLLLIGAYCLPFRQFPGSSSGYSIVLSPSWSPQEKITEDVTGNPLPPCQLASESEDKPKAQRPVENPKATKSVNAETIQEKRLKDTVPEPQDTPDEATTTEQVENRTPDLSEAITAIDQHGETTETIDERSLYRAHQGKQTGALLELAGWMWDATPQPQDDTDESGKIVFQITIDDLGEVIAVKTLEKTVSPLVENIYKEALTKLNFSKTTDNIVYAPTFAGKITFMLQVK